ncbi:heparinase II/III family protein [Armatimonas sp.]|uniref:heparinase II/III domain-containing protein n=1 Tax=Armatimonas sp. TaxID=1872638 RepID=UPI0037527312
MSPLPTTRPLIWVTPADRTPILAKIAAQPWAKTVFSALQAGVKDELVQHQRDRDAYLRGFPLIPSPAGPTAHPTFAYQGANGARPNQAARQKLMHYVQVGIDCGVLYFLTEDKAYAACAADILTVFAEAMVQLKPSEAVGNGGYLYPSDHLLEARILGAQIPLVYDFVASYLQAGATVYDLATRQARRFNFENGQTVFRRYARLAIDHGLINCNWPVLEMPSLAHNVLALDDPAERAHLLTFVTQESTRHQDALKKVLGQYARPDEIWPESFQYSGGVSSLATYLVALMERQGLAASLTENYANIPLSLARIQELRFPNGENIRFGDGPRKGGAPYDSFEIAYALGQRLGDTKLQTLFGGLINLGMASKQYDRAKADGHSGGANPYFAPLQLLWFSPKISISGKLVPPVPKVTDTLPFVGAVLQRNLSPTRDPKDALMAVVSGGSHVHGHASGMALELYGKGQVLGANAGKGSYTTDEHENYRRLFAAYNTVIVNGASRSSGGWVNLGTDTVQIAAMEPKPGEKPLSTSCSFSLTRFTDNKSPGAKATQERLVALVRTSATTGYYVDIFRSRALPDTLEQFHDYVYHNVGDGVELISEPSGLTLSDAPGRFRPVPGAVWKQNSSYLWPGWHVFDKVQTSAVFSGSITAHFHAKALPGMRLFLPGVAGREYARALAPSTHDAPTPYDSAPTPVLVVRQRGEAWNRPFAVVYEPVGNGEGKGSIVSVTPLTDEKGLAGLTVVSKLAGWTLTQHVLVRPCRLPTLGLELMGQFAVVTLGERSQATVLYLGEGTSLRHQENRLSAPGERRVTAAPATKTKTSRR